MDANGLTRLELEFLMDWFFDPGDERRQASDRTRDLLFDAAAALDAHHIKVGNIPATPADRRSSPSGSASCAKPPPSARMRRSSTSSCRSTSTSRASTRCSRSSAGGAAERRHRDRHLAHVEARDRARRAPSDPARVHVLDRALRRPVRGHGRPDRRGRQPPQPARRGRVRPARLHRRSARITATLGLGASRRSPRSCATTRST